MGDTRRYPRTARVNELLRQVIAETLERDSDDDDKLGLITITSVEVDPDLRNARVFYTSLGEDVSAALEHHRVHVQTAIAKQVRIKRTPHLHFHPDPSVEEGWKIESIVRSWHDDDDQESDDAD